jgi:hypothetical protein
VSAQTPAPQSGAPLKPKTAAPARKVAKPEPPVTSLAVIVTDHAGKPVEGAVVVALPAQSAYRPFEGLATEKIRWTLTGREGKAQPSA